MIFLSVVREKEPLVDMANFTANLFRMNVAHLEQCELEYELILRGLSVSEMRQDNERRLRSALRDDEKENRDYLSWRGSLEEYSYIGNRLKEIEENIIHGANITAKSRLYHYYLRLRRCQVQTPNEEENRYVLVEAIKEMLLKYFNELIDNRDELYMQTTMNQHNSNLSRHEVEEARPSSISGFEGSQRFTGAIPKVNQSRRVAFLSSTRDNEDSIGSSGDSVIDDLVILNSPITEIENPLLSDQADGHNTAPANAQSDYIFQAGRTERNNFRNQSSRPTQPPTFVSGFQTSSYSQRNLAQPATDSEYIHVSQIESYVQKCVTEVLSNRNSNRPVTSRLDTLTDQLENCNIRDRTEPNFPRSQTVPSFSSRRSNNLRDFSVIPGNLQVPPALASTQRLTNVAFNRSLPNQPEMRNPNQSNGFDGHNTLRNPFESSQNFNARNFRKPPHHLCKIIGTWPKFCGDNNTVPLVSFLRTIDMLCRSYEVDKEELKPHAHLLFTGDAYTWYMTYVDRFTNWDTLLYYLTIRYDNPNRDRYIKEEMRNRKQKPNELFSAFLTEIEALSQRLINPMSEIEKFDIVVENMKISYKRRLALEDIRSIEDLAQKCYRFDALESNLFSPKSRGTNAEVHVLCAEDEDYEDEYINAIQSKGGRRNPKQTENKYVGEQNSEEVVGGIVCWNCRGNDHIWKFCPEEKRIFCHICGYVGKTAFNCPNNHQTNNALSKGSKNAFQESV